MMEENKTIFSYIGQLFATYGMTVAIFLIFGSAIGETAEGYSTLFALGGEGFTIPTLLELLLLAGTITILNIAFMTDRWIKNMRMLIRNICFFGLVVAVISVFSIAFGWFPIDNIGAWMGFGISFLICTVISVLLKRAEEKAENRKMEKALEKLQMSKRKE